MAPARRGARLPRGLRQPAASTPTAAHGRRADADGDGGRRPDESGQGAPVVVRIYQLGSTASFSNAEFFPLFNSDSEILKSDLLKRDDYILAPGQTKTTTLMPTDTVKALGVFAGYRDYHHATWRGSADVAPHKTTRVKVTAGASGITVTSEQVPPPPPPKVGS